MIICHNCKGNGYVRLKFENEESIGQCKVCDSQGKSMKISTTTKLGPKVVTKPLRSTTDHRLTQNVLKTTRFRESKPVIEFKGEPPF